MKSLMKILGLCLLAVLITESVFATAGERGITVSGECLKRVEPDRGTVTLIAEFTDKTAAGASKKTTETYEQIRTEVKKMKLKDLELQTSQYSLGEDNVWENNKQVKRGMKASIGLQISTSEISRLGDVVALTGSLKINRVENLSTYLSPKKMKDEKESCLVEAIANARSKAEKMAGAAAAKVGPVQSIDENGGGVDRPMALGAMMKSRESSEAADLAPGIESRPETISVNVQVRFGIQ